MGRRPNRPQPCRRACTILRRPSLICLRRPIRSQPCRRACTVLGSTAKSLTALPKSVHGSWVGGQIAHSLAEERPRFLGRRPNRSQPCRRACTVLGSAAKSLTALPKSVHGSWVGGQIAHSLAEERARFLGRRPNRSQLCRRACTVLGSAAKSLTVLLKSVHGWVGSQIAHSLAESVHGSWVGGRIAHSLARDRRACTVLGSAAKSLTVLLMSVHGSWVGGQIAHSLC